MEERPIYLTTKRILYNMARVDFRYGRVTKEYVDERKQDWENEYNLPNYEIKFGPKTYE